MAAKKALPKKPRSKAPPAEAKAPKRSKEAPRKAPKAPRKAPKKAPMSAPIEPVADAIAAAAETVDRIRDLERRVEELIDEARERPSAPLPSVDPEPPPPSVRSTPPAPVVDVEDEATVFDTARELLKTDFYLRTWGRIAMRDRSEEVDDFGYDPVYDEKLRPLFEFLHRTWFRVESEGTENVPSHGRCLLVANHSGTVPLDGVMLKMTLSRDVRWLVEDFVFHFPFLGSLSSRIGAVRACQENAERLLAKESLIAVFPEGTKGIGKLFRDRYRLQRFGRGGFVKLALRTRTPIVPVAIVGAEETNPLLFRIEALSKTLGVPYVPVTPTFPWLGPLGLVPAPTKWRIRFGEPISTDEYGAEAEGDEVLVGRLAERVRGIIQGHVDAMVGARRSVFFR